MKAQSNIQPITYLQWYVRMTCILISVVTVVVLIGWFFNLPALKTLSPGMPALRFNTALSFLLLSAALWHLKDENASRIKKQIGKSLAGIVLLISLLTLSQYLFRWDLGIDQLFVQDLDSPLHLYPGRIAPIIALGTGFCSLALRLIGSRTSQPLSVCAFGLSIITILSYVFDIQIPFRQPANTYVALYAGIALLVISVAIIAARPAYGIIAVLTSDLPGSKSLRVTLPGMLIVTIVIGWLAEYVESMGILNTQEESLLLVIILILVYSPLIYFVARGINQSAETLENREKRFRALIENGLDYISLLTAEGNLLWESPSSTRMLNYKPNEFVGSDIFALVHPDDLDRVRSQFAELFKGPGAQEESVFRLRHSNGTWRWVEAIATNLLHIPSIAAIVLNYRDVTERKQAEETIQESERQMRGLITSLDDIVFEFDGRAIYLNVWVRDERLLALPRSQMLGRSISDVLGDEIGRPFMDAIQRVLKSGISESIEYPLDVMDGQHWFLARISPIPDSDGTYRTVSMLSRDITQRRQVEEELRVLNTELEKRVAERTAELYRTNAELEHANRAKDEFLANMSHELRTPLNSILGLSETLLEEKRGTLNESQQKALQIIESGGHHLLELINDILDLSKIEAGKFDFFPQQVSVDQVCRSSLNFIKSQASKKSIVITYHNRSSVTHIDADVRRLKQVLVNLLSNAVKFTPENGHVTLRVISSLEENRIQFSVIDDGVGIAPDNLRRIFEPFVQVDSSLNRQHEGSGLGLALVQKLIDLHSGSIQVESEVGKGSCFKVNLACQLGVPITASSLQETQLPVAMPSENINVSETPSYIGTILLAEDNLPNILTMGEYLESYGYKLVVAHDGMEAIARAEECNPDLILMDIQMPVMNGLEAIATLRANARFTRTPILALTALAMPGDRERCLSAGATDYMSKPVSLKLLRQTIEMLLHPRKVAS